MATKACPVLSAYARGIASLRGWDSDAAWADVMAGVTAWLPRTDEGPEVSRARARFIVVESVVTLDRGADLLRRLAQFGDLRKELETFNAADEAWRAAGDAVDRVGDAVDRVGDADREAALERREALEGPRESAVEAFVAALNATGSDPAEWVRLCAECLEGERRPDGDSDLQYALDLLGDACAITTPDGDVE